ncbi:hypothetical protein pb186bvf_005692 [Paramecium bursaria]
MNRTEQNGFFFRYKYNNSTKSTTTLRQTTSSSQLSTGVTKQMQLQTSSQIRYLVFNKKKVRKPRVSTLPQLITKTEQNEEVEIVQRIQTEIDSPQLIKRESVITKKQSSESNHQSLNPSARQIQSIKFIETSIPRGSLAQQSRIFDVESLLEQEDSVLGGFFEQQCKQQGGRLKKSTHLINVDNDEVDAFLEKGQQVLRKVLQIIQNNRDKRDYIESEAKKKKPSVLLKLRTDLDPQLSTILTQSILEDKSPRNYQMNQQISVISKQVSQINHQQSQLQQSESLKPMKSLVEAIKEKSEKKEQFIKQTSQFTPKAASRKIKLTIVNADNQSTPHEYELPGYLEDSQINVIQQSEVQQTPEVKEAKQSNIYSLVSKSILSKKIGSQLVKLGKQAQQVVEQESTQVDYSKNTIQQYTRYYLQNNILRSLNKINDPIIKSDQIFKGNSYIRQQSSNQDQAIILKQNANVHELSQSQKEQGKNYSEILYQLYSQPLQSWDSQDSIHQSYSDISYEDISEFKLKFIESNGVISSYLIKSRIIKPLINQIDDESKNQLLNQQMDGDIMTESSYKVNKECKDQLEVISELYDKLPYKVRAKVVKLVQKQYEEITQGPFVDHIQKQLNSSEKDFILCGQTNFGQTNSSQQDASLKVASGSNVTKNQKENTFETVNKQKQLLKISMKANKQTVSRSESPSNQSDARTQKQDQTQKIPPKIGAIRDQQRSKRGSFILRNKSTQKITIIENNHAQRTEQRISTVIRVDPNQQFMKKNKTEQGPMKRQTSMDPYSLLFRNLMLKQSSIQDKSFSEKLSSMIEQHNFQDLKEVLKHENININFQDDAGNSLLIQAARSGADTIVQFLLQNGADVNLQNQLGQTAYEVALMNYQYDTADVINQFSKVNLDNSKIY